jgi:hypothetical protein
MANRTLYTILFLFIAAACAAFVMTGGSLTIDFTGISATSASAQLSGGSLSMVSSSGNSVGAAVMAGGNYSVTGEVSGGGAAASSFLKTNLSEVIVFPNPYRPGSGGAYDASNMTFRNLTSRVKIRIFNIAAELVRTIEADTQGGQLTWDASNENGEKVASGVYIYVVTNPDDSSQKAKGKFAIIK